MTSIAFEKQEVIIPGETIPQKAGYHRKFRSPTALTPRNGACQSLARAISRLLPSSAKAGPDRLVSAHLSIVL